MRVAVGLNADIPVREILNYANEAEGLGYDGFWVHEHSFGRDAISVLSSAALFTSRINLGVACLNPYTRHPIVLAQSLSTLHETSKGRASLGIGSGFPMRLDMLGIHHARPIGAIKETMDVCRAVWEGRLLDYNGSNFALRNVKSLTGKTESKIPIYVAGWKKKMLELTGNHADGYVAKGGESIASIRNIISDIRRSAEKNGRDMKAIDIGAYLLTFVADTQEEALQGARRDPFVNYMLSVQDDYLYEGTGIDPKKKKPIAENYFAGKLAESSAFITDEMLNAFTLVGTEDKVCSRVLEFTKLGLDLPILQPISMKPADVRRVLRAGSLLVEDSLSRV